MTFSPGTRMASTDLSHAYGGEMGSDMGGDLGLESFASRRAAQALSAGTLLGASDLSSNPELPLELPGSIGPASALPATAFSAGTRMASVEL